jgi:hypothetical protein
MYWNEVCSNPVKPELFPTDRLTMPTQPWAVHGGFGVRAFAKSLVVRIDTAVSHEGVGIQMMVN